MMYPSFFLVTRPFVLILLTELAQLWHLLVRGVLCLRVTQLSFPQSTHGCQIYLALPLYPISLAFLISPVIAMSLPSGGDIPDVPILAGDSLEFPVLSSYHLLDMQNPADDAIINMFVVEIFVIHPRNSYPLG